ncbi:RNA polymerase sigma factor [Paenibacillus harenae]|uniref:RNA polymerase sigma factor n=1 Tax=Paenibacillus harenae TaxID=306543 RepID=UPI0027D8C64D|nr:sigma-70 family RNA polymerase sigma factor [Paenibacillus harenae]
MEEKVRLVQTGHTEAFSVIVSNYQQQLFVYCCRMLGNEQDAEDAVQDIFLKAFKSIASYKPSAGFNAWMYKISYHHCLNLAHRRRLFGKLVKFISRQSSVESAEQSYERNSFSEPLSRALASLEYVERNLLILYVFHEKTYSEIGVIINKSPESVRKKLTRVRKKIKVMLNKRQEEEKWAHLPLIQTKS